MDLNLTDRSVKQLLDDLKQAIMSADAHNALGLAKLYGNMAWHNHVGIYSAHDIECHLLTELKSLGLFPAASPGTKNGRILHVLSDCYVTGGHTRVVERLVECTATDQIQDVLIGGICPPQVQRQLQGAGATIFFIEALGLKEVAAQYRLMAAYSMVILHISPDDIVAALAAAAAKEAGTSVGLYNHADHCFTYGLDNADMVFEVSVFGRVFSQKYRPNYTWSFAGIPLPAPVADDAQIGGDYFLSSGPAYKYDFTANGAFAVIVEELAQVSTKQCVVVGPGVLPRDAADSLRRLVEAGRLTLLPPTDHARYSDLLRHCHSYIDSSPITGGSAFPEAALAGKPCLGLTNAIMGYSPIDAVRSATVAELVYAASDDRLEQRTVHAALLQNVHGAENVLARIRAGLGNGQHSPIPYMIDETSLDPDYMAGQWRLRRSLALQAAAFDFLSLRGRWLLLRLLWKHGLFASVAPFSRSKVFLSNFAYRKLRSRSIRRIISERARALWPREKVPARHSP